MSEIFFKELEIPAPKYQLSVGSGKHGEQTAKMIEKIEMSGNGYRIEEPFKKYTEKYDFLKEKINKRMLAGMALIVLGIIIFSI